MQAHVSAHKRRANGNKPAQTTTRADGHGLNYQYPYCDVKYPLCDVNYPSCDCHDRHAE